MKIRVDIVIGLAILIIIAMVFIALTNLVDNVLMKVVG